MDITDPIPQQVAGLLSLTAMAGGAGTNDDAFGIGLVPWIACNIENDCFTEPISRSFMFCNVFRPIGSPPCGDEFDTLVSNVDVNEVLSCFIPSRNSTHVNNTQFSDNGPLRDYNIESDFKQVSLDGLLGLAICLWRAIQAILDAIRIIIGIVAFVLDLIENGIQIPCELIPFFYFLVGQIFVKRVHGNITV